jgi:hypothetical protein
MIAHVAAIDASTHLPANRVEAYPAAGMWREAQFATEFTSPDRSGTNAFPSAAHDWKISR